MTKSQDKTNSRSAGGRRRRRRGTVAAMIAAMLLALTGCTSGELTAAEKAAKAAALGFGSWQACVAAGACSE
jgi:hypothetical protein